MVDNSYLCHLLAVPPYHSTGQMVISALVLKKMDWVRLARNKSPSRQKRQRRIHRWERLMLQKLQFCWTTGEWLCFSRATSLRCWISHSHTLRAVSEREGIWQDPSGEEGGVVRDGCQRQRSALRLQQLSSNRSRVCSQESNAQFLLAKIQLLLTRKQHPEQSGFTAGGSAMRALCPTAIGRETPAAPLPFTCCLRWEETCFWFHGQRGSVQGSGILNNLLRVMRDLHVDTTARQKDFPLGSSSQQEHKQGASLTWAYSSRLWPGF